MLGRGASTGVAELLLPPAVGLELPLLLLLVASQ